MGTVTYSGNEVAFVAGAIANQLPQSPGDFEMLDLILDRAIAAMDDLDDEVLTAIEGRRDEARNRFEEIKREAP